MSAPPAAGRRAGAGKDVWTRIVTLFHRIATIRGSSSGRRQPVRRIVLVFLFGLLPILAAAAGSAARPWGTVSDVMGGRRLTVRSPDLGQVQVQLLGIDLPELPRTNAAGVPLGGQPYGVEAADYVRDLLLGRQVQLDVYGKDRAGRLLSVVWLGDINVNLTLVKEGLAWVVPSLGVTNVRVALEVAERQAQVGRYGLWSLPDPEPPWEYRKRNKLATQ